MKKYTVFLLTVILSLVFTSCGMAKMSMIEDIGQLDMETCYFDIAAYTQLVTALQNESADVTYGKIAGDVSKMCLTVKYADGFDYYLTDFENKTVIPYEPKNDITQNRITNSFIYNDTIYYVTFSGIDNNGGCIYLETANSIKNLTENGLQGYTTQSYCDNGYVIIASETDTENIMHYRVYSVAEERFIIDENIEYSYRNRTARWDILSWVADDRLMYFDTKTGQITDVTEDFTEVDSNSIDGDNSEAEKMAEYRCIFPKTFYTIDGQYDAVISTMNNQVPYVNYIDSEKYQIYQRPHYNGETQKMGIAIFTIKEDCR